MNQDKKELLPCPFCGSHDIRNVSSNHPGPYYHLHAGDTIFAVNCGNCGASVPNRYRNSLVIEAWNTRAAPVVQPAELAAEYTRGRNDGWEAAEAKHKAGAPLDKKRLCDDITEEVAKQLHYFDNAEKINTMLTAKEVSEALDGSVNRYRNDYVFHARVSSLVASMMQVIAAAEGKKC